MNNRLYRSPTDRVIGGVAGGLAVWLNIDPSLVRIAWVLLAIFSGGIFLLVYFVMMLVVPLPPEGWVPPQPRPGAGPAPGGWQAPDGSAPSGGPGAAPGGWQSPAGTSSSAAPASGGGPSQVNSSNASIVGGIVLIVLGAWFLVDQYLDLDWALLWPVLVIALGAVLIGGAVRRSRSGG